MINEFVNIAKDLEIKEISEEQDETKYKIRENMEELPPMDYTNNLLTESNDETNVKAETNVPAERSVARHIQRSVASTDGRFSCDECEATFSLAKDVIRHKKSKHEGDVVESDGRYSCEQCDVVFSNTGNFNR